MMKFLSLFILIISFNAVGQTVSITNFRETYNTIVRTFELDYDDAELFSIFVDVKNRLPVSGQVAEVNGPALLALLELTATACRKVYDKEVTLNVEERKFFASIDFKKAIGDQTDKVLLEMIFSLHQNILQRAPSSNEAILLLASFKDMASREKTISKSAVGVCSLIASSIDMIAI